VVVEHYDLIQKLRADVLAFEHSRVRVG